MKTIIIISQDVVLTNLIDGALKKDYQTLAFSKIQSALDIIYNSIPNLIILEIRRDDETTLRHLINLKEEPIFSQLPVLAVVERNAVPDWNRLPVDDYIKADDVDREIVSRVQLCVLRSERVVEINPLTRLPGNISINRQIQERIEKGEMFAFAYADLDHFKPFNDKYGFSRGDEVIRITGRLILNIVRSQQSQNRFVGHIGGDDFVFITDINLVEQIATDILDAFDRIIPTIYDPEDREKGCIESVDRQGIARSFPIMSLSIGVTDTRLKSVGHYGAITEAASEMKKYAKQHKGSCYKYDRRQDKQAARCIHPVV